MPARHRRPSHVRLTRLHRTAIPLLVVVAVVGAALVPGTLATPDASTPPKVTTHAPVDGAKTRNVDSVSGLPAACDVIVPSAPVTCDYSVFTDSLEHGLVIPAGATNIQWQANGGQGGPGTGGPGGAAAQLSGTLPSSVIGHTLWFASGSSGSPGPGAFASSHQGGTNPGATRYTSTSYNGGAGSGNQGGGGAASTIGVDSTLLVVAAGGAGGGSAGTTPSTADASFAAAGERSGFRTGQTAGGTSTGAGGGGGRWAGNGTPVPQGGDSYVNTAAGVTLTSGQRDFYPVLGIVQGDANVTWTRTTPSIAGTTPSGRVYAWGAPIKLNFGVYDNAGNPTGTVTVTDTATHHQICSVTLSSGAGSCDLPASDQVAGANAVRYDYSGDGGFAPTSTTDSFTVLPNPVAVSVAPTLQADGSYQIQAAATPSNSGGIADGTLALSASPAGTAFTQSPCAQTVTSPTLSDSSVAAQRNRPLTLSCNVTLPPGTTTVTAAFTGTANSSSASAQQTVTIAKYAPGSVDLTMSPQTLTTYGATSTATVTVSGPANAVSSPSGVVAVAPTSGSGNSCTATSPSSVDTVNHVSTYTCTVTPAGGSHDYLAAFAGDAGYAGASSTAVTVSATSAPTTLTLTPSASTVAVGHTLDLVASATTGSTSIPQGTVTIYDGPVGAAATSTVGTIDLATSPGGGTVTVTPAAGTHTYYATYADAAGSTNYTAATVQSTPVYVQPLSADLTVDIRADATGATAAGIPTTVTATLAVPVQDTRTQPLTVSPAPSAPCTRTDVTAAGTRTVTAVCSYVRQPGTTPAFTASYTDDLVATLSTTAGSYRIPASPTTTTASATSVDYGDQPELDASVTPAVTGAGVSGTVRFAEGSTTLCTATLDPSGHGSCQPVSTPTAGAHAVVATYTPDATATASSAGSSSPSTSFTVRTAAVSIALSTAQTAGKLTVSVSATVDGTSTITPSGSITFGSDVASCGSVALSSGVASCTVALPAAGTKSTLSATYQPSSNFTAGKTPSVTQSYQRPVSGPCSLGFAALWAAAQGASSAGTITVGTGGLGSMTLTVPSGLGSCDAAGVLSATADFSLFGGTLSATGARVSVDQTAGLCVTSGSVALPGIWNSGALAVTQALCFPLTAGGSLGTPTGGALALATPGGSGTPLVSIPGVTGPVSLSATIGNGALGVTATVPAVSATVPGATVTATVRADGGITGSVATTALSVLGASVPLTGTITRTGTGTLSATVGATLAAAASPTPGLTLLGGTSLSVAGATGSSPRFAVSGTVRVAGGSPAQVDVAVTGSFTSPAGYHLALATAAPAPSWTPVAGLTFSPTLTGSLDRTAGTTSFALSAQGSGGSPLATWTASGGVGVDVGAISLGGDPTGTDPDCPATGGLVLALTGTMSVRSLSAASAGCISLTDGSWHVGTTATTSSIGGLGLSHLALDATHGAGGSTTVTGSATATLGVGTATGSATVAISADADGLVIGGGLDTTSLGLPTAAGYLAYASSARKAWPTGLNRLGTNGALDLPAGVSLTGALTLPSAVAGVLRKAQFTLPSDATLAFAAAVPAGATSLTFSGTLATPSGFPLLTLPGGSTVQAVSLTYAAGVFGLTADGTVPGQDGSTAPAHLTVSIAADGSFAGSASVTGLNLFGRSVDLAGAVNRTSAGVISASIDGSLAGSVTLGDAVLHDVSVGVGSGGLTAAGSITVAGTSVAFTAALASTTAYALTVSSTVRNWTPTAGVTVNAVVSGALTRTAKGYTYDFAANPLAGATRLIDLVPTTGVDLGLTSFELSNGAGAPAGCTSAAGDTWLSTSGSVSLSLASSNVSGSGRGCFDLTHPAFTMTVQVPGADLGGSAGRVTLGNVAVVLTRDGSGFHARATARLGVQMATGGQFSVVAALTFGPDGFALGAAADLSSYLGDSAAHAYLYYANTTISVDTGDSTVGTLKLTSGVTVGLTFSVGASVASALRTLGIGIGQGSSLAATAHLDLTNPTVTLRVDLAFAATNIFSESNGTFLRADTMALAMTLSPTQPKFGFQTTATLHVPASTPGGQASEVGLTGGISIGTELSAYLSVDDWNDALGERGFDLADFTLQGGITLTGLPLPSLAFSASVTGLPPSLADVIGYQQGAPMSISVAIGETNLLFDVKIGSKDSSRVALAPLQAFGHADLLTVNYAELYLSPTGATIGDETYPAGFSLAFQGRVVGVTVDVFAKVDPAALSFYFRGSIGTISVGSLIIGPTTLTIDASPTSFNYSFSGHVAIGPSTTQIGPALRLSGSLSADLTFSIGTSGISAHMNFAASVSSSSYLPRSWCSYYGFYYPCNWGWVDTPPLTIRANNIGFAINSSGFTLDIPNTSSSITFPWPTSVLTAHIRTVPGQAPVVQPVHLVSALQAAPARPAASSYVWQPTGSLGTGRLAAGTATLRDGSVVVAGGSAGSKGALATVERYEPQIGGWVHTAPMHTARINPTTVELRDGRVLVVGGDSGHGALASAEIFNPVKGTWTPAGSMSLARESASATVLADGSVLVAGGHVLGKPVTTVDRYFPSTGRWQVETPLPSARAAAATATLSDGRVLLAGGMGATGPLSSVVLYDPATGTWHAAASMVSARFYASATRLDSGDVLVAGGAAGAERYNPTTDRWSSAGSLTGPTLLSSMATLPDGDVLVAGGLTAAGALTQVDRYHPATNHWTAQAPLPSARAGSSTAVLANGQVLVAGGLSHSAPDARSFRYTPRGVSVASTPFRAKAPVTSLAFAPGDGSGGSVWVWAAVGGGGVLLLVGLLFLLARRRTATVGGVPGDLNDPLG